MAQIKFYRGAPGVSLPRYQNGAVFVVDVDDPENLGDLYVDVDDGKRLQIKPNDAVYAHTTAEWGANPNFIPKKGQVCVYTDYKSESITINNQTAVHYVPGIKVGDGLSYLIDLPFNETVTQKEKSFWDNKVTAYVDNETRLVLSIGLNPDLDY